MKMEFCEICNNMLYIRLSKGVEVGQSAELIYYCRDSSHSNDESAIPAEKKAVVVLETQVAKKEIDFSYIVNEYTTMDPTLPRLKGMKCPNSRCASRCIDDVSSPMDQDGTQQTSLARPIDTEVVFLRYDDDALKYLYICPCCSEVWKSPVS